MTNKKKIKLYTHTDMDGYSCSIILKLYLENQYDIDVEYLNYSDLDDEHLRFKKDIDKYEHIFITDLNFKSMDMVEILFNLKDTNNNYKIHYIDHHKSDLNLQEMFTFSGVNFYNGVDCATKLLRLYLLRNKHRIFELNKYNSNKNQVIMEFVDSVDAYDTWKWKNSYCTERIVCLADQLSMLFNYWSGESFEEIMLTNLKASTILTSENLAEVKTLKNLKDKYIFKKVSEALIYTNIEEGVGSCFAYVEAEQYGNEISDIILNIDEYRKKLPRCPMSYYPKVNYVVIRQRSYLSFRSKNECAKGISELFEGGGHLNASGAPIPLKYITKIPKLISDVVMGKKIIKNNEVYLKIKEE